MNTRYWMNVWTGMIWREVRVYKDYMVLRYAGEHRKPATWPDTMHETKIKVHELCAPIWMKTARPKEA